MEHYGEMVKMTEEQVTKTVLDWLIGNNWEIITYDFPQSGTGKYLHPNKEIRNRETKNEKSFIPDIVAVRNTTALFFENKNRFFLDDFIKLKNIREDNIYSDDIDKLLSKYYIQNIYYGIAGINSKHFIENSMQYKNDVDFIVTIEHDVSILSDKFKIF